MAGGRLALGDCVRNSPTWYVTGDHWLHSRSPIAHTPCGLGNKFHDETRHEHLKYSWTHLYLFHCMNSWGGYITNIWLDTLTHRLQCIGSRDMKATVSEMQNENVNCYFLWKPSRNSYMQCCIYFIYAAFARWHHRKCDCAQNSSRLRISIINFACTSLQRLCSSGLFTKCILYSNLMVAIVLLTMNPTAGVQFLSGCQYSMKLDHCTGHPKPSSIRGSAWEYQRNWRRTP